MDKEAAVLRRELARVEKGRGKRYPEQLRRRVMAWAAGRPAAGASWQQIKRELGQRFDTVRRWCTTDTAAASRTRAPVPVRIVRAVAVVSPTGFRVDGLTLRGRSAAARASMILGTSRAVRVFAYPEPVDLRKGYYGLLPGIVKPKTLALDRTA